VRVRVSLVLTLTLIYERTNEHLLLIAAQRITLLSVEGIMIKRHLQIILTEVKT
jgi:hypothetical protein